MKNIKYILQFICILFLFGIFKVIGLKYSRILSGNLMTFVGPIFRSKSIIFSNLSRAFPNLDEIGKKKIQISVHPTWLKEDGNRNSDTQLL